MACGSILSDYKSMEQLEKTFDFGKRSVYDSTNSLARLRSSRYKRVKQPVRYQTWNRPAPDLRMQLYHPQPLPRNSLQAIKPWNYKASFDDQEPVKRPATDSNTLPSAMRDALFGAEEKEPEIAVSPRMLRPWEAKILFVKEGSLPKGTYSNPKPHDHRGYPPLKSLGLPEFTANYEKDPYNIHFKTNNLDIVHGLPASTRDIAPGKQMGDSVLRQPPKWESKLHLPHFSYPTRQKNTTRHRPLYRSPHSAFMERVENKLSQVWHEERTNINTAPANTAA